MSVTELDRIIDEILSRAEAEKENILKAAKIKAAEILKRPIPIEDYRKEAEEIVKRAKEEADKIIREAEEKAREIRNIAKSKLENAVKALLEYVTGLKKE